MKSIGEKDKNKCKILSVKINTEVKNNPKIIIQYIKDVDEIYIKVLFFLYCYDNLDEIDVKYLSKSVKDKIDIEKIIEILDFWHGKEIIEYRFESIGDVDEGDKADKFGGLIDTNSTDLSGVTGIFDESDADKLKAQNVIHSVDKMSETIETKDDFRRLIHDTQLKFKFIFNPTDISILYNLCEVHNIDIDLLLKLADVCVVESKDNLKYFEKIAIGLSSNGIFTVRDYEKTYNEIFKIKEFEKKILRLFKLKQERKFTSGEKTFMKKWALEFNFSDKMIEEGYNICMKALNDLNFRYVNGIFSNWHAKGFKTFEDVKNEFSKNKGFGTPEGKTSSFNIDLFFEKAVQKAIIDYDDDDEDD